MDLHYRSLALFILALLLMAGCGAATPEQPAASENIAPVVVAEATATRQPTADPQPTAPPAPTNTPEPATVAAEPTATAQPVAEAAPTATPEPAPDWTQTATLIDGLYVRGNPNAPIRLIDYSDFF